MGKTKEKQTKEKRLKIVHFRHVFFAFMFLLLGVIFARKIYSGDLIYILIVFAIFVLIFFFCLYRRKFIPVIICVLVFAIGNGLYYLGLIPYLNSTEYYDAVVVVGRVTDNFEDHGDDKIYLLEEVHVNGDVTKNIRVQISGVTNEIEAGDIISFESIVDKIKLFEYGNFDNSYVRDNAVYETQIDIDNVVIVDGSLKFDETIRQGIKNTLLSFMSEENAYIAYAVITGEKSGIDSDIYKAYRDTGIVHVLTVSGLHVGVLAAFIAYLFKLCKVNKWVNFVCTTILLFVFSYICGFAPSVMRASVMSLVFLLAKTTGKQSDSLTNIGIAGIAILAINPLYAFDSGFLMSFFCVILITLLYKPLNLLIGKIMPKWVSSYISMSLCAQIGILPFIASFYSTFNFLTFFINLIVVPIFSIIFVLLLISTILTSIFGFMGFMLSASDLAFSGLNWIALFYNTASLSVNLSPLNPELSVVGFLIVYTMSWFVMINGKIKSIITLILASMLVIFAALSYLPSRPKGDEIYYYGSSFSQGVLLRSKEGRSLVIGQPYYTSTNKFLDQVKIRKIDYLFVSDQVNFEDLEYYQNKGVKKLLSIVDQEESVERKIDVVYFSNSLSYDGFKLQTCDFFDEKVGIRIVVNDLSLFFAFNESLGYNECKHIEATYGRSDCLISSYKSDLRDLNVARLCITNSKYRDITYSYKSFGNMRITENNEKLIVRSID